eukprot:tig00020918_g15908.t1
MTKGHSMMDIGEGSKKQRQSLKNDLKGEVTGIIEKYAPGTILPEVHVTDPGKADIYTPEDQARGLGLTALPTKTLPAMKYTPQMEKLMRMGIRQQLQNAYPNRQIKRRGPTEATLGEQIEARWGRFLDLLEPEAKEPGVRAQIQSLRGIGATAVIVLFRRHINAEAELIRRGTTEFFEKLPQEYASAVRSLF